MKKIILASVIMLGFVSHSHAQNNNQQGRKKANKSEFINRISLEAGYGYNQAFSPDSVDRTDVSGFNTFQVAANYKLDDLWGVRGSYANSTFKHKDFSDVGINYNKLMAEATFDVLEAINKTGMPDNQLFELKAHAGLGLTFAKSKTNDSKDTMGNFQIGIKPQYNVSQRVGIFLDGSYVLNFSQNLGYNGIPIPEDKTTGGYVTGLIGVSIKLGN